MPYFYDLNRAETSNASANTVSTHMWVKTVANQETLAIYGVYAASRFATAGGAQLKVAHNTGTTASGGTAQTPAPKNLRGSPAAQSVWANDASAITAGATLIQRLSIGFAQTGGMGGYVPIVPTAAIQLMPNATNPVDAEFQSDAATASVTFDLTVDIGEGI
jgi:hypothetical protein